MSSFLRSFKGSPPKTASTRPPKSDIPSEEMIRKRTSWNGPPLRPDPFRFGHPNPLGCHPVFNDKHPDYIIDQAKKKAPTSGPDLPLHEPTEPSRLELCTDGEHLGIQSLDDPLSCPIRVDSLYAMHSPAPEDRISESVPSTAEVENATPRDVSKPVLMRVAVDKLLKSLPPVPELKAATTLAKPMLVTPRSTAALHHQAKVYSSPEIGNGLLTFIGDEEAIVVGGEREREIEGPERLIVPLQYGMPSSSSQRPTIPITDQIDYDAPIKYSEASGLPRGWTRNHDRLIAYLDTHAKLEAGWIPDNEAERERYDVAEMAAMLREKFEVFKNVIIPHDALSRRLEILDLQDNKYFDMPYFCYEDLPWGTDI